MDDEVKMTITITCRSMSDLEHQVATSFPLRCVNLITTAFEELIEEGIIDVESTGWRLT